MQSLFIHYLGALLSLGGLSVSIYLWHKKKLLERPFCPLKMDCSKVITSPHAKVLGMPVEILGTVYYALSFLFYSLPPVFEFGFSATAHAGAVIAAVGAGIFSMHLLSLQAFAIRGWCSWCIASAILSLCLAGLGLFTLSPQILSVLWMGRQLFLLVHVLAVVVGMGGAFMTDRLFFKFLNDRRISPEEAGILSSVSGIIWVALGVVVLSGLAIFLPAVDIYAHSAKFLAKMTVILVIIVNGIALNLAIAPKLIEIHFAGKLTKDRAMRRRRRLAFALGAVSVTSWLSAFILAMLKGLPHSYGELIGAYVVVLIAAVLGSQLLERVVSKE